MPELDFSSLGELENQLVRLKTAETETKKKLVELSETVRQKQTELSGIDVRIDEDISRLAKAKESFGVDIAGLERDLAAAKKDLAGTLAHKERESHIVAKRQADLVDREAKAQLREESILRLEKSLSEQKKALEQTIAQHKETLEQAEQDRKKVLAETDMHRRNLDKMQARYDELQYSMGEQRASQLSETRRVEKQRDEIQAEVNSLSTKRRSLTLDVGKVIGEIDRERRKNAEDAEANAARAAKLQTKEEELQAKQKRIDSDRAAVEDAKREFGVV